MAMKTKQTTMDTPMDSPRPQDEKELEERHLAGYRRLPPRTDEFDIPESDHAWGDEAWPDD